MKNKNLLIIVAAALILIIGGVYFFTMNKSAAPANQTPSQNTNTQSAGNNSASNIVEASIKSFLTNGNSVSCTYSNDIEGVNMSGKLYANAGKIRQDFETQAENMNISGHMIMDSADAYMWTDQMDLGFKFSVADMPTPGAQQNTQTPDINKNMKFNCTSWTPDNSVFEVPSNITFQTMNLPAMQSEAGSEGAAPGSNMSDQCAVCDNIPAGPGRDSCRAQLKCS